ncbi:MAG: lysozyme inhibitor LprI family protein [Paracoccaceae bacterium]|nr:lysozyme inhibitor LprI family protein [Paracoccaceae bacterium]
MRWFFILFSIFLATSANSASFDCTKASTEIEHAICSDKNLSFWDEQMANAYRQIPKGSRYFEAVREAQRAWLKNDRVADRYVFEQQTYYLRAMATLASCLTGDIDSSVCPARSDETLDKCMAAGNYTTVAMNTCGSASAKAWDLVLDVETVIKFETLSSDPETQILFQSAAKVFDNYLEAECGWRYSEYRDGTIRGQIFIGCYQSLTERRVVSLFGDNQLY